MIGPFENISKSERKGGLSQSESDCLGSGTHIVRVRPTYFLISRNVAQMRNSVMYNVVTFESII